MLALLASANAGMGYPIIAFLSALTGAFASPDLLARAHELAVATGLTIHEFGDSTLVLPGAATVHRRAA